MAWGLFIPSQWERINAEFADRLESMMAHVFETLFLIALGTRRLFDQRLWSERGSAAWGEFWQPRDKGRPWTPCHPWSVDRFVC